MCLGLSWDQLVSTFHKSCQYLKPLELSFPLLLHQVRSVCMCILEDGWVWFCDLPYIIFMLFHVSYLITYAVS